MYVSNSFSWKRFPQIFFLFFFFFFSIVRSEKISSVFVWEKLQIYFSFLRVIKLCFSLFIYMHTYYVDDWKKENLVLSDYYCFFFFNQFDKPVSLQCKVLFTLIFYEKKKIYLQLIYSWRFFKNKFLLIDILFWLRIIFSEQFPVGWRYF